MAMKWCDRQDARMFSTLHSDEIGNTGKCERKTKEPVMKPKCTVDWCCTIVAVLLCYIQCIHKAL
jgi:hypothetical protein